MLISPYVARVGPATQSKHIASEDNAPILPAGAAVEGFWLSEAVAYPPDWWAFLAVVVPHELHPEPVFARFRFLDASVQPLLAIGEPLLPPLAEPPAGELLWRDSRHH